MSQTLELNGSDLKIEQVYSLAKHPKTRVSYSFAAKQLVQQSKDYIGVRLKSGEAIYGVNTGFGAFSDVSISSSQIVELQKNLIRSHACGIGEPFSPQVTRAIIALRANALLRGHSGIRIDVIDKLLEFLNHNCLPYVPSQGSVGASGDLAPLSHVALALIGEGYVWNEEGTEKVSTRIRLQALGIEPLVLQEKEGLSLINGCQVMTALGLIQLYRARNLLWVADIAGASTLEALRGSRSAFDPLIAQTRPHPGEAKTARNLIRIMGQTSQIAESHLNCGRVQDAYSLRCMPAVHGATKDSLRRAVEVLEVEANSSTDNPLVFALDNKILSCGNFHGEPVAFQLDFSAIALSAMSSMSECRIAKLINPQFSQLPAFLAPDGGLNSGHMIVQVAAASLVSENKGLSHPASVDSIPTSVDKEDHVSMGTIAARKFERVVNNAENILAMELLSATQALDMLGGLQSAAGVKAVHKLIRQTVPFADKDRFFAEDIAEIKKLIETGQIVEQVNAQIGELEW